MQLDLLEQAQASVRETLKPYEMKIAKAIRRAWERWRDRSPEDMLVLNNGRTRSSVVWSYMVAEVARALPGSTVKVEPRNGTQDFVVENKVMFRLKKMNGRGKSRNFATRLSMDHYAQIEIPGMPELVRLDIGYVLNRTASAITEILVSCRYGKAVVWNYSLLAAEVAAATPSVLGRITPQEQQSKVRRSRVRVPKRVDEEQKQQREAGSDGA